MKLIFVLVPSVALFLIGGNYLAEASTQTIVTSFSYSAKAGILPDAGAGVTPPSPLFTAAR